ncbi:hypothetical protein SAMN04488490_0508 [Marinobacter sp. LV10R510-11A]|nr:hypothetical protein SAMN04488490_0508 [Marinobacter sp. LV10R510-11A]
MRQTISIKIFRTGVLVRLGQNQTVLMLVQLHGLIQNQAGEIVINSNNL